MTIEKTIRLKKKSYIGWRPAHWNWIDGRIAVFKTKDNAEGASCYINPKNDLISWHIPQKVCITIEEIK